VSCFPFFKTVKFQLPEQQQGVTEYWLDELPLCAYGKIPSCLNTTIIAICAVVTLWKEERQ